MFPASEIGGDARLELPPASKIKTEQRDIGGKVRRWWGRCCLRCPPAPRWQLSMDAVSALRAQVYTYIAFISDTTTRSGYQVRRERCLAPAGAPWLPTLRSCCGSAPGTPRPQPAPCDLRPSSCRLQVRRKNMAVAATRSSKAGTLAYVLGCSARSDQFDAAKEQTFQTIVESFRLL